MMPETKQSVTDNGIEANESKGYPVRIVEIDDDDHSFKLNEEALDHILCSNSEIKDLPICVVSVAGAFRKGKSFLLDFFLRYLNRESDQDDWVGGSKSLLHENCVEAAQHLEGFSWRGGSERVTSGILMWSKVFISESTDGKRSAIILLDTQGAFDSSSTFRECATVFALSTMISSVLVYNVSQNIQEDDLQNLQLFTEYGRLAALEGDKGEAPFQKLQFLVRDWSYPYEAEYGSEGGKKILKQRLQISSNQPEENQKLRNHIKDCFQKIEAFLLPHPGLKVATDPNFTGQIADIEPLFIHQLKNLIPSILSPKNVLTRKINGSEVKSKDLCKYLKAYVDMFKSDQLPDPKSIMNATSEANNLASLADAKEFYIEQMEQICGGKKGFVSANVLNSKHTKARKESVHKFDVKKKMGGEEFSVPFRKRLENEIQEEYEKYQRFNQSKSIFRQVNRTPITLIVFMFVNYLFREVFGLIGVYSLSNLCNGFVLVGMIMISSWMFIKCSGHLTEFERYIDILVTIIWNLFLSPLSEKLLSVTTHVLTRQAVQNTTTNSVQQSVTIIPNLSLQEKKNS